MRDGSRRHGIRIFDLGDPDQGISHVVAPELGMVLPGATHAVPDSHACTVGGLGALAFGCGTTELEHVLATQVIALKKPKRMRVRVDGRLGPHVTAKDVALRIIAEIGVAGGRGFAIEFAGAAVRSLAIESRLTLCNLTIEMGARSGFVAPDDTTFEWLAGRPFAPTGAELDAAMAVWRTLASDEDAAFDQEVVLDAGDLEPQITWGTDPSQVVGVNGRVPDPAHDPERAAGLRRAIDYMGLAPGMALAGLPVDRVFIGSCTNNRLPDLQAAAAVVRGRRVADRRDRHGGAGLHPGEARRRGRRARPGVPGGRLLLGRVRMLHVRRQQRRPRPARRALHLDHQPQLREPPGPRRAHAPRQPRDRGRRGDCGPHRRRAPVRSGLTWSASPH